MMMHRVFYLLIIRGIWYPHFVKGPCFLNIFFLVKEEKIISKSNRLLKNPELFTVLGSQMHPIEYILVLHWQKCKISYPGIEPNNEYKRNTKVCDEDWKNKAPTVPILSKSKQNKYKSKHIMSTKSLQRRILKQNSLVSMTHPLSFLLRAEKQREGMGHGH